MISLFHIPIRKQTSVTLGNTYSPWWKIAVSIPILLASITFALTMLSSRPRVSVRYLGHVLLPGDPARVCSSNIRSQWVVSVPDFGIFEFGSDSEIISTFEPPDVKGFAVAVAPNGSRVFGDDQGLLVSWPQKAERPTWFTTDFARVFDIFMLPDRDSLIASGDDGQADLGMGGSIKEYDIDTGMAKRVLFHSSRTTPWWLACDAKQSLVACLLHDGTAVVIDLTSGTTKCHSPRPKGGGDVSLIKGCDMSADGSMFVTCGDRGGHLWNVANQRWVGRISAGQSTINKVRFANKLNSVLGLSDDMIHLWSIDTRRIIQSMSVAGATGNYLSTVDDDGVACFTVKKGVMLIQVSE